MGDIFRNIRMGNAQDTENGCHSDGAGHGLGEPDDEGDPVDTRGTARERASIGWQPDNAHPNETFDGLPEAIKLNPRAFSPSSTASGEVLRWGVLETEADMRGAMRRQMSMDYRFNSPYMKPEDDWIEVRKQAKLALLNSDAIKARTTAMNECDLEVCIR